MRIRRSVTRFFGALVIPALCAAAVAYYGYYLVWGNRGLIALTSAQARLAVAQDQLADVQQDEGRLKHRIQLLNARDPDIIQEIARDQLLGTTAGQVAVPREKH
jgi:cell division protein FtsB